jgi:glycerophosphoryl diester phosphodiesterase
VIQLPDGLFSPPFAHRGLWSADGFPENSLSAIELACQAGYGSEFDVRLAGDGEPVVFHDDSLERMTGRDAMVSDLGAADLASTSLLGGTDTIPLLVQALELVRGRQTLLIELKSGPDPEALAARTAEVLRSYDGPFAVIGFDATALGWFARRLPDVPRGLDAMWPAGDEAQAREELDRQCALARPHFLVLELKAIASPLAAERRATSLPVIAWTVRSTEDADKVAEHSDNFIFEGFTA